MDWSELCFKTTNEAVEPVSNIFHEAGASGVVIEDRADFEKVRENVYGEIYALDENDYPKDGVILKAYLPQTRCLPEVVEHIKQEINHLKSFGIDLGENEISMCQINEEAWATAWKKYYKPVKISELVTITPTWETYTPTSREELVIELDPGMAFGTGTHPTTVLCVQALERYLKKDDVVLDVGTGTGVLSIAAAKLGAGRVKAYDLDEVAVKSAQVNTALNNVHDQVTVFKNDLLHGVVTEANLIVANILAEIIVLFDKDAYRLLCPGGYFITSGIISKNKEKVLTSLVNQGFTIIEVDEMEDWVAIIAQK